jgi:NAD+ kinase
VTASPYPFPTVCADKQSTDWFHSIARTLKWNERQRQKSFVILEEGRKKPRPSNASEQTTRRADSHQSSAQTPLSPAAETTRGRSPSKRGDRQSRQSTSRGAAKRATFADTPDGGPVCEYDDDEDDDELDEDEDDTAEEYDIDDVSESSPSISASDPPAPAGGIPSMSSKSTSPTSDPGANDSLRPSMEAASATRSSFHRPDFELLSNASSVSVDIQDDVTERYCDIPPKGRARSRSRARLQQEQAQKRSSRSGGGAVSIDESDDDKSRDRAFAVLGHDDDDSSQVRLPLSLRPLVAADCWGFC